jgi:hypothetical protein
VIECYKVNATDSIDIARVSEMREQQERCYREEQMVGRVQVQLKRRDGKNKKENKKDREKEMREKVE